MDGETDRSANYGKVRAPDIVIRPEELGLPGGPHPVQFGLAELTLATILLCAQSMLGAWMGRTLEGGGRNAELVVGLIFGSVGMGAMYLSLRICTERGIRALPRRLAVLAVVNALLFLPPSGPLLILLIGKMHGMWRGRLAFLDPET
ncbi:MAG: hypothetical protein KIS92_11215 [Planctomycetota bacterium]|nr:hypothetical protein [Planctomycetota bacterium]